MCVCVFIWETKNKANNTDDEDEIGWVSWKWERGEYLRWVWWDERSASLQMSDKQGIFLEDIFRQTDTETKTMMHPLNPTSFSYDVQWFDGEEHSKGHLA